MTARKPHRRASSGPTATGNGEAAVRSVPEQQGTDRAAADGAAETAAPHGAARGVPAAGELSDLLGQAAEDDPRVWGDSPDNRDSWFLEQRPPHWD
ncbi:hypothetical protein KKR91_13145 [Arthrobacter jiangjiafuii]|uniref:Uncharacterized protein n=1 Tax=Arthrobacter jiangjiafuii TaxID=2817475 RepID=A0A975QZR8_9MICC|nr:hypothetical protein [Arthrobacter jiangjiafuii]QWC09422.1 hypothetical protein KKR91_13145 [Arthrobacter jiangjiafuii]